jgi:putative protein-disulfide isomerase
MGKNTLIVKKYSIIMAMLLSCSLAYTQGKSKNEIIYVGDPMCSWCYGFGPELDQVKAAFPEVSFKMVMGGLRAGGTESLEDLRDFLAHHWEDVEKASGQRFNHGILKSKGFIYDTTPACKAVTLIRRLYPEHEYAFFQLLQKAFFHDNQSPVEVLTYLSILEHLKLDTKEFNKLIYKDDAKDFVNEDFQLTQDLGVNGFPTLIAKVDGKYYRLTSGYMKADRLINMLKDRGM